MATKLFAELGARIKTTSFWMALVGLVAMAIPTLEALLVDHSMPLTSALLAIGGIVIHSGGQLFQSIPGESSVKERLTSSAIWMAVTGFGVAAYPTIQAIVDKQLGGWQATLLIAGFFLHSMGQLLSDKPGEAVPASLPTVSA